MQSRHEFLATLTAVGGVWLAPPGRFAGAQQAPLTDFRGIQAGQQRVVHGVALCWCPPGRFMMGSPAQESGRRPDESQVDVTHTRGFWTAKFEVTQRQWREVIGPFPDRPPSAEFGMGDDFPMYWVNFPEAERFCSTLTEQARRADALPSGWEFSLPTEAEWEYACRATTRTATSFGDILHPHQANFDRAAEEPNRATRPPRGARPVGSYPANPWGMHDMHGNVWEWCRDWYHARLPGGADPDLSGIVGVQNRDGSYSRVRRGGAWIEAGWACRSACRLRYEPLRRSDHIGFRVVARERQG